MPSQRQRPFAVLFLAFIVITLLPGVAAAGGAIFLKGGAMRLQDDRQTFDTPTHIPVTVGLDRASHQTAGFAVEHRFRNGWAVGFDYLDYENRFTQNSLPSARGITETDSFAVTAKKYFMRGDRFHPYVGGGFGIGHTEISNNRAGGLIDDFNTSLLLHAVLGVELRIDNLSLLLEARTLYHDIAKRDVEYDPSSTGLMLGMGVNW